MKQEMQVFSEKNVPTENKILAGAPLRRVSNFLSGIDHVLAAEKQLGVKGGVWAACDRPSDEGFAKSCEKGHWR